MFFEEINSTLNHSSFAAIRTSLTFLQFIPDEDLNPDIILPLRKRLLAILQTEGQTHAFSNPVIYKKTHAALVVLARYCPLNTTGNQTKEVLNISWDKIAERNAIGTSSGHIFDVNDLAGLAYAPRGLFNPITNLPFSQRDTDYINQDLEKRGLLTKSPYAANIFPVVLFSVVLAAICAPPALAGVSLMGFLAVTAVVSGVMACYWPSIKNCCSRLSTGLNRVAGTPSPTSPDDTTVKASIASEQARLLGPLTFAARGGSTTALIKPLQILPSAPESEDTLDYEPGNGRGLNLFAAANESLERCSGEKVGYEDVSPRRSVGR